MAMRLVRGQNDVGAYLDQESAGFADAEVCAMADRITLERDPGCTFENPLGRVTLHLRGGDMLTDAAYARGSPGNPVTPDDIKQKYRALVSRDFGEATAQRSLDMIMDLENVADLRQLTGLFETPG
jgi:2-methylcitrate dehydratase PrpD